MINKTATVVGIRKQHDCDTRHNSTGFLQWLTALKRLNIFIFQFWIRTRCTHVVYDYRYWLMECKNGTQISIFNYAVTRFLWYSSFSFFTPCWRLRYRRFERNLRFLVFSPSTSQPILCHLPRHMKSVACEFRRRVARV